MNEDNETPVTPAEAEVRSKAEEAGATSQSAEADEASQAGGAANASSPGAPFDAAAEHASDRDGGKRTLKEWADKKGHVPAAAGGFGLRVRDRRTGAVLAERLLAGPTPLVHTQQKDGTLTRAVRTPIHTGPHYLVVAAFLGRPVNQLLTEAEYDEAVKGAYSVTIGESPRRRVEG